MKNEQSKAYPIVEEIVTGWTARGEWWAVHAPTKEEAIAKYKEREKYYKWLAQQPPVYEKAQ